MHERRIVLDVLQQGALLIGNEVGRSGRGADRKGVNGARPFAIGRALGDAINAAPADSDRHELFAVDFVG